MAGVKGRSGPKQEKPWRDALLKAVSKRAQKDGPQFLERVADAVVAAAVTGDMQAAKEIGDRLDGKPRQEMDIQQEAHSFVHVIGSPAFSETTDEWQQQHAPKNLQ